MNRNIILLITIILIITSIIFLENFTARTASPIERRDVALHNGSQRAEEKAEMYPSAIELVDPEGYINTDYINISQHIGKNVVLLDFWTYSCINCQRTFPYLISWHKKYADDGLVIIGVHTPEFAFEQKYENVVRAVEKYGIPYPVVQDNDYQIWRAYGNRYWPRKYIIDVDGFIAYDHIGEGAYEETEEVIQQLLEERQQVLGLQGSIDEDISSVETTERSLRSPEIYFGYGFSRNQMGNKEGWQREQVVDYNLPKSIDLNKFYIEGEWFNDHDFMELRGEGSVVMQYHAREIHAVAGAQEPTDVDVSVDGKYSKTITVQDHDLYTLAETDSGIHILNLTAEDGLQLYTFTFG